MKIIPAAVVILVLSLVSADAQGTAFTYQGRLTDSGQPANGKYNFRFLMFDAASDGTQQGVTAFGLGVPVSNGLFSVKIDFGVLPPADRWLEIWVRLSTSPGFTILSPRQKLMPTPYSITAGNLSGTLPASQLTGTVPLALLPGAFVTNNQSGVSLRYTTGSESVPSISFGSDTNTGLFHPTAGSVGVTVGGNEVVRFDPVGTKLFGNTTTPGRFYEQRSFSLGYGLFGTPNPAAGPALYVDDRWLIVGDQQVLANGVYGREGVVLIYTNFNGLWARAQTLTDHVANYDAGWFGYCLDVDGTNMAVGSTHSSPFVAHGFEGDVQTFWLSNNVYWHFGQFIRPTNWSEISDDEFGDALAIKGNWLLVGAPWYDYGETDDGVTNDTDTGAVWFYNLTGGVWTRTQGPVVAGQTTSGNVFGIQVEISGTNAFVGASPTTVGKVYVFTLNAGTWLETGSITQSPARPDDCFGNGIIQASGSRLMVTASQRANLVNTGAVFFFEQNGSGTWTQTFSCFPADMDGGGTFYGNSGSMKGDIAIVGARFADNLGQFNSNWQATNAMGKAHIFRCNASGWKLVDVLAPNSRKQGDLFASDVYTDGTNVYAIAAGARRGGTNAMVFYQFTNAPPNTADTAAALQGLGDQQFFRTNWPGASQGSFYRDWTRRQNTSPYNLNNDGAITVVADTPDNLWATNYVTLTNFPGIDGSCVFVARSNNFNVPSLYWTFTNLDSIRGIDVEVLWVTNGANSSALGYSRSLNITFSERTRLFESNLYSLSGANGGHFNFHADSVQLGIFTNIFTTLYTEEDYLGRKWMNTWDNKENEMCNFTPRHGSIWHCGFEFMSPITIRVYSGPNEWIRSLDLFTSFDRVRSFWLESSPRYPTNLSITACPRSVTVFTHQKNTWPRWFYVTTNGMVLKQTVVTN